MMLGKVRPYCDKCKIDDILAMQIVISNAFYYCLIDCTFACLFIFNYNRNDLLIGKLGVIAGFIYFVFWLPFDIIMFTTDLPGQIKLMQSEQFSWIYSIVIFGIALIMGLIIANKLDHG